MSEHDRRGVSWGDVITVLRVLELEVYEVNVANGWFEEDRTVGDDVALLHSEVSEMLEAYRDKGLGGWDTFTVPDPMKLGIPPLEVQIAIGNYQRMLGELIKGEPVDSLPGDQMDLLLQWGYLKPEGFGSEAADVLIRLLDTCKRRGVNLSEEYRRKILYNRARGYRHGGKKL